MPCPEPHASVIAVKYFSPHPFPAALQIDRHAKIGGNQQDHVDSLRLLGQTLVTTCSGLWNCEDSY